MELTKKILIAFIFLPFTTVFGQYNLYFFKDKIDVNFENKKSFDLLSLNDKSSPFYFTNDWQDNLSLTIYSIKLDIVNGDTLIKIPFDDDTLFCLCHFEDSNPVGIWTIKNSENKIVSKVTYTNGVEKEIELKDKLGEVSYLVLNPKETNRRIDKWFYKGINIKTIYFEESQINQIYLFDEQGEMFALLIYDLKSFRGGSFYNKLGVSSHVYVKGR